MNFLEAMALLNANKSITRKAWDGKCIVLSSLEDMSFKFWLPESQSELMRVTDWIECEPMEYFCFKDAIEGLLDGAAIKRPKWSIWFFMTNNHTAGNDWRFFENSNLDKIKQSNNSIFERKFSVDDVVAEDWMIEFLSKYK